MPCYHPNQALRMRDGSVKVISKKRVIDFVDKLDKDLFKVPCTQCIGCRLSYSKEKAIRCVLEAETHSENCFITLTYNDKYLPLAVPGKLDSGTLFYRHLELFWKRLRKKFSNFTNTSRRGPIQVGFYLENGELCPPRYIRYFAVGEYGDQGHRPHYHAILFNVDFPDKEFYTKRGDHVLYTSKILHDLWVDEHTGESLGYSSVGSCSYKAAGYCARYSLKKVKGTDIYSRYIYADHEGEIIAPLTPERAFFPNKPGLAHGWFLANKSDVFPKDSFHKDGIEFKPPRYFDKLFEKDDPDLFKDIKEIRLATMRKLVDHPDFTPQRLRDAETVKSASITNLSRSLPSKLVSEY